MTYHKEEYTLHNGKKIYAEYDDHNICQITKECLEMLLDLYQQGREDAIDEFATKICEILEKYQTGFNMVSMANIWLISRELAEELKAGGKNE